MKNVIETKRWKQFTGRLTDFLLYIHETLEPKEARALSADIKWVCERTDERFKPKQRTKTTKRKKR